jgi:hypothetical protein
MSTCEVFRGISKQDYFVENGSGLPFQNKRIKLPVITRLKAER